MSKTKNYKYLSTFFIFMIIISFNVGCTSNDSTSSTAELKATEGKWVDDEELKSQLLDLAYASIEIQNGNRNVNLNSIYTDSFIKNTIESNDDFYIKVGIADIDPALIVEYGKESDMYEVFFVLETAGKRNMPISERIMIEKDTSGLLKIYDIIYRY